MSRISVDIEIKIVRPTWAMSGCILHLEGPLGYVRGEDGHELYFNEHDGVSLVETFPAISRFFPQGTRASSNGKDHVLIEIWEPEAASKLDGRVFKVRLVRTEDDSEASYEALYLPTVQELAQLPLSEVQDVDKRLRWGSASVVKYKIVDTADGGRALVINFGGGPGDPHGARKVILQHEPQWDQFLHRGC